MQMEGKSLLDNIFRRIRLNKLENDHINKLTKLSEASP